MNYSLIIFPPLYSFNFLSIFFIELFLCITGYFYKYFSIYSFISLNFIYLFFYFPPPIFIQYFLPYHFVSPFTFHLSLTYFFKFYLTFFFYSIPNPSYTKITIILSTPRCKIIHHHKSTNNFLDFHFLFFFCLWGLYYYFLNYLHILNFIGEYPHLQFF